MSSVDVSIDISALVHFERQLSSGGSVLVLNRGEQITAEDCAMLQALYSRSPAGIRHHLAKLAKVGSGKFMESHYVGYGHKSIGDCGDVVIFIEGVSMLAAKAVQDWMLYNGQEVSTRYLDFSTQPFINPTGEAVGDELQEKWRQFYIENLGTVQAHVAAQFPRKEEEDEKAYQKAVNARAFDILRGFLPAGTQTSLSWTTNLRQAADHLKLLRHHPIPEVRDVAEQLEGVLAEAHQHSFGQKRYEATEAYNHHFMEEDYLYELSHLAPLITVAVTRDGIDKGFLRRYERGLKDRPPHTELPKKVACAGTSTFLFGLDFGSYRDLQRHRAVIQQMPLLTIDWGFHQWYLDQLPEALRNRVVSEVLPVFEKGIRRLPGQGVPPPLLQYLVPMGYRVPCEVTGDLPALVYLVELRSGSTVHPTLRHVAQLMAQELENRYGDCGLVLHIDHSDFGRFDVKRGHQDITQKVTA